MSAFNIPNNSIDYADISANTAQSGYLDNTGSYEFEERLLSNFLRIQLFPVTELKFIFRECLLLFYLF